MRAMSLVLADLALRTAAPNPVSPADAPDAGPMWTPDRAAAWRAWADRGAAERGPSPRPQSFGAAVDAPFVRTVPIGVVAPRRRRVRWLELLVRRDGRMTG
jgi:hypothetical protein